MKNDDRKKYLKRLKIQNVLLLIIIIIGAIILAYRILEKVNIIGIGHISFLF